MSLFFVQTVFYKRGSVKTSKIIQTVLLAIAIAGIFFSYSDFRNTLSHRLLGERFHLGVYLFWLGWIAITIFLALQKKLPANIPEIEGDKDLPE